MQIQDVFIKCSEWRPFNNRLFNKITGNGSRIIIKLLGSIIMPVIFKISPGAKIYNKRKESGDSSNAIVTMTSFPARIRYVWLVVECLLRQTRVPSKIVIYLSNEQFKSKDDLPSTLSGYSEEIVEIKMVDGDIRSHKKYWYAVEEFIDRPIVTVDDDIVYDSHLIEDLENHSSKEEKIIACCWGARIQWNEDGTAKDYSQWGGGKPDLNEVTDNFFFGSGGGTYFPVGSLNGANQPISDIMEICPSADDIWLNAIARKNRYCTCLIRKMISVPEWNITNNQTLRSVNVGQHQNIQQLRQVRNYFVEHFGEDPFSKHKNNYTK